MKIGVIGCGNISGIYFENLAKWPETEVIACADLDAAKAATVASERGIEAMAPAELLGNEAVSLILNLTVPLAHYDVSMAALRAGKHVYVEKPLATTYAEGKALMDEAKSRGLTIGCAPDTVLGAGIQTCRSMLDAGDIGTVHGGNAFMLCPGHERWHPDPGFYYQKGGGPLFDMGPYYLSALVMLLGPIRSVTGITRTPQAERTITSQPKHGQQVPVETPTHIIALLEFAQGAVIQFTASFDVQASILPHMELYGSKGSLLLPDPNGFGNHPTIQRFTTGTWEEMPLYRAHAANSRGLGLLDQVQAIAEGRESRASGAVGLHVLEAMEKVLQSAEMGKKLDLETTVERPLAGAPQE